MINMSKEFLNAEAYSSSLDNVAANTDYRDIIDEAMESSFVPHLSRRSQIESMCPMRIYGYDITPFSDKSAKHYGSELADCFVEMFIGDTHLNHVGDPCPKMKKLFENAAREARKMLDTQPCHMVGFHDFSFDEVWEIVGS